MNSVIDKIEDLKKLYSDRRRFSDESLLDDILAVYGARKAALIAGDMDVYEENSLELNALTVVILGRMKGGEMA